MAGKGSALLLLAGKLGKGAGGKKPPRPAPSEPDLGADTADTDTAEDEGAGTDKEVAGEDLATALKQGDHRAIYEAVCAILAMHKAGADSDY